MNESAYQRELAKLVRQICCAAFADTPFLLRSFGLFGVGA